MKEFTKDELDNEVWKAVPNYEGLYDVSDLGRVKSLKFGKERILKQTLGSSAGYYTVSLCKDRKQKTFQIHQLLAITFLGHMPDGHKIVTDHIDNDKTNNRLDNLQLISQRKNCSKDKKNGISKFTGVDWDKLSKKWRTRIRINGKEKYLGLFNTEEEARAEYDRALKEYDEAGKVTINTPASQKKSSKYKGVSWHKSRNKWRAQITINGKRKHLGYFSEEYDAHLAYERALDLI